MNEHLIYTPSQLNSGFYFKDLEFSDYILAMQDIIYQSRKMMAPAMIDTIVAANSPTEHVSQGSRHGILLIHGLFDSCAGMASLYHYFSEQGYFVRNLLLPGHGTRPADLLEIQFEDWITAASYALESMRPQVDHLTIIGASTGANIAIYLSLLGTPIDQLVLFAPALKLQRTLSHAVPWLIKLSKILKPLKWASIHPENDYTKYQSVTLNAVYQLQRLCSQLKQLSQQKALSIPIFMILSADDETIVSQAAIDFFVKQPQQRNRLIIYSNKPDNQADQRIKYLPSEYPENDIINFSHHCLTIAPEHPHYGVNGDFIDYSHYHNRYKRFAKTAATKPDKQGAVTVENLQRYHLKRLHYNPDFHDLVKRIEDFLGYCSS